MLSEKRDVFTTYFLLDMQILAKRRGLADVRSSDILVH